MMKAKNFLPMVAGLCGAALVAHGADSGTVKGSRVNVRGKATLQSETVTQLKQGETVKILEEIAAANPGPKEPAKWYRIALPSDTPVWVHSLFIKDGKVEASRLNVRSGPGENYSVLGRVDKGATIREIRKVGDWLEIQSPAHLHGFVAASLVEKAASSPAGVTPAPEPIPVVEPVPVPVVSTTTTPPVLPPPPPLEVVTVAAPASASPTPVVVSPIAETVTTIAPPAAVPPTAVTTETVVARVEGTPEVKPSPLVTLPEAPPAETGPTSFKTDPQYQPKTWLGRVWARLTGPRGKAAEAAPGSEGKFHQPPAPPAAEGPLPVRIVTREGMVVRSWNIQSPSDYALKEVYTGRVINYLWTTQTNVPWEKLVGRTVIVSGEEAVDPRWQATPVLRIETLKTLDNDGEG